ncbi:MAG: histidine phosphatase family protein [Myxococcales bacterium]|nr:histidine phosphatase family protein [Myxococcales bacterium]
MAWARRDENLDRLWEDVIRLGFDLVDDDARPLARRTALGSRTTVHLSRKMCPFSIDRRIGFFTHSLIGNALILLGAPDDAEFPDATGAATTVPKIARYPNRHYISNAHPLVLGKMVLIRHGETEANAREIALGRSDGLDDWRGHLLADISDNRQVPPFAETWHRSTLKRTEQTAEMFGVEDAEPHADLDEMDIGVAEGIPEARVLRTFFCATLMYDHGDPFASIVDESGQGAPSSSGESFADLLVRVARCLETEIGVPRSTPHH